MSNPSITHHPKPFQPPTGLRISRRECRNWLADLFPNRPDLVADPFTVDLVRAAIAFGRTLERWPDPEPPVAVLRVVPAADAPAFDWRCPGCGMDRYELKRKAEAGQNLNLAEKACWRAVCGRREAWERGEWT